MSMNTTEQNRPAPFKFGLVKTYWAITTLLLIGVVSGIEYSYASVVVLNTVQVIHFALREKNLTAFPVEVRSVYLGLLILSQAPYMIWILWWQLIGTAAMVLYNYCFLARLLSLSPWRKSEDYSLELVKRTFFSAPVEGSVMQGLPAKETAKAAA